MIHGGLEVRNHTENNLLGVKGVSGLAVPVPHSQVHKGLCAKHSPLDWVLKPLEGPKPILLPRRNPCQEYPAPHDPRMASDRCRGPLDGSSQPHAPAETCLKIAVGSKCHTRDPHTPNIGDH